MTEDRPQDKLRRVSDHFDDLGLYVKANYCLEIIDYIDELEKFQENAFLAHPNLDLDIEFLSKNT